MSSAWSEWFGNLVETGQSSVGEWFEREVYEELGLTSEQEDAHNANSIGLAITSAGREQIGHEQQLFGNFTGGSGPSLLLAGLAIVAVVLVFKGVK